jgi:hypothetical protein
MRRPVSDDNKKLKGTRRKRSRFVDLAYRLVRSTDPDEQDRLKDALVRSVRRRRARAASADVP